MFYLLKFENKEPTKQGKKNGEKSVLITTIAGKFEKDMDAEDAGQKNCGGNYLVISKEEHLAQFTGKHLDSLKACLLGGDPSKRVRTDRAVLDPKLWAALTEAKDTPKTAASKKPKDTPKTAASKKPKKQGVRERIRNLFHDTKEGFTMAEIIEKTKGNKHTVQTVIHHRFKQAETAGKLGVLILEKNKEDKKFYYESGKTLSDEELAEYANN